MNGPTCKTAGKNLTVAQQEQQQQANILHDSRSRVKNAQIIMDIPLKVVVRFSPLAKQTPVATPKEKLHLQNPPTTATSADHQEGEAADHQQTAAAEPDELVTVDGGRAFRFSRVFRADEGADLQFIYAESIAGITESVLEGYDFSVVSYGEKGVGKSYTLYGNAASEGIVLCFVKDLFCQLAAHPERMYSVGVAWTEITAEGDVIDVLGSALMQCFTIEEIYSLLSLGLHSKNPDNHNILSLILEQQWTSLNGLNQHRQSTISFCDLSGTEREVIEGKSVLKDSGLRRLEDIVLKRSDDFNESILTAFLKDSFGGRAQTLIFLCMGSLESEDALINLEFGEKAQEILNHVVMNTFSDNNVPIIALNDDIHAAMPPANYEGLYFASQQWSKLLKNAESLFNKLFSAGELNQQERGQIEEWLYLKAECDECFSSTEISINAGNQPARVCLGPIEEIDEGDDTLQTSGKVNNSDQCNSDNESDSDICTHLTDMTDRIQGYMRTFQLKTNNLINEKYKDFFQAHPKMIDDLNEEIRQQQQKKQQQQPASTHNPARRKSIFDAESISSNELSLMSQLRSDSTTSLAPIPVINSKRLDALNNNLRITVAGIESLNVQIEVIRCTIALKQEYIKELIENSEPRSVAKLRFNNKKRSLEDEYEKTKKQLANAVVKKVNKKEISLIERKTSQLEQRMEVLEVIRRIAGESGLKKKKLQQSVKDSQKQLEVLQKMLKKELEKKDAYEREIEVVKKEKTSKLSAIQELGDGRSKIKNMNERISHIEHVLKEKSSNLKKYVNKKGTEKDSLRQEIINLRRTRDHLLEQRCALDRKIREEKMPTFDEERKLVECDEAIEAIDAAIEMKNELICGRKSIDTDESLQREKGEQMLMARLNKLSSDEMRTLLYKYFQKVVDLKENSRKLELQFISLERERDAWAWQEKILTNTIRQTRLEKERTITALKKQHDMTVNLMMRHCAADTSASISSSLPENALHPYAPTPSADLVIAPSSSRYHHHHHHQLARLDSDSEAPPTNHHHHSKHLTHFKTTAGVAATVLGQPLAEKDRKNKLFSKLQMFARIQNGDKRKVFQSDIPQQNLKQLENSSRPSLTKVTREKNKIIIQHDGKK
ncbi:kinesin-like protein costa [Culex pipiens pallens]|uniref:kinesin-like protein costa n=1 Tax=Culex pipiens pallens TaxID=42434 RepID=UPI0022AA7046|nr:kinesin-like protein costa [Culex pipiens pallens]